MGGLNVGSVSDAFVLCGVYWNIYRRSFYSIEIYDGRILVLKWYNSKIKCNGAYKIKKGIRNAKHIRGGSSKMKKGEGVQSMNERFLCMNANLLY